MSEKLAFVKKTKIIATYGPACEKKGVLENLFKEGVNVIRLNASHTSDPETLKATVKRIRKISKDEGYCIGIFLDLQGPKIRVGTFKEPKTLLKLNSHVKITVKKQEGSAKSFYVDYPLFLEDIKVNDPIFIDDGKIKGIIEEVHEDYALCKITTTGVVSNHKGVNLPASKLSMTAFTEKDKKDAITAIGLGIEYVALSFASSANDLITFKQYLKENGGEKLKVISKIERQQAVDNLEDIIKHSDAVMVARGDLGVEIGVEKVPVVQKRIIKLCNRYIKPVIVATQMLESMIQSNTATRAEVSDVANAIYDRCDMVMLSAETAVGIDPVNVVKVMTQICKESDKDLMDMKKRQEYVYKNIFECDTTVTSFCKAANQIAEENNATAIMAFTSSGNTPLIASKINSVLPIIAPTDSIEVYRCMSLYRGVTSMMMPKSFDQIAKWTDMINMAVKKCKELELLKKGDKVVVTAGIPIGQSNGINSIRIITV